MASETTTKDGGSGGVKETPTSPTLNSESGSSSSVFGVGTPVVVLSKGVPAVRAVVRFVGTTSFARGEWYGVELEEPAGKNDGSVQGVRYFNVKPNYGLFVRETQLRPFDHPVGDSPAPSASETKTAAVLPPPPTDSSDTSLASASTSTSASTTSASPSSATPFGQPEASKPEASETLATSNDPSPSAQTTTQTQSESQPPTTSSSAPPSTPLLPEVEPPAVPLLTEAFLSAFAPTLEHIGKQLSEIQETQGSLLSTLESELAKVSGNAESIRRIQEVFARIPEYDSKTQRTLKEISSINERMQKVKAQTAKLQARKLKDDEEELRRVRKALEKERQLLARPATDDKPSKA